VYDFPILRILALAVGVALEFVVLQDAFETIILPRTVNRDVRLTTLIVRTVGKFWYFVARRLRGERREAWLGAFAPLSTILLILMWAVFQIVGFGLFHWGLRTEFVGHTAMELQEYFFFSGGAFFTVGSDYVPATHFGHFLSILESGLGFAFLGLVIGYVPVITQQFGAREAQITLFDARAGSPSTAFELYRRYSESDDLGSLADLMAEWEKWCAELLQSFMSYPILAWYRSQHDAQSWLSAITTILDACALAQLGFDESHPWAPKLTRQSKLTFAIARHTVIDLALITHTPPAEKAADRLPTASFRSLQAQLESVGVLICSTPGAERKLRELRDLYEPYLETLGKVLFLEVPPFCVEARGADNWQTSAFDAGEHFASGSPR
jgi:hypothetical protein